ncbi:protein spdB [Streptomyces sp. NPDC002722]|uniref:protein spdB n=1 Tax=Streptomyces sp. NPDC002722 TaxID=3154425 RepID=UPI003331BEF4
MTPQKRNFTAAPAVAMTVVSMVLTLAVVVMWLGQSMPVAVALVVGLGIDGGWLATLAYDRRLAAQGDHSTPVTVVGWGFGLVATGVLVAHALGEESSGAWLAVAWLPIAAKLLWLVHGLWEQTALTPRALDSIRTIQQDARDKAAVARAQLRAEAGTEETRLTAVTEAGARVARTQSETAKKLADAWSELEGARQGDGTGPALTCVTERVTPASQDASQPRWELPVWGSLTELAAIEAPVLSDADLEWIVTDIIDTEAQKGRSLSYREVAALFRAAGHSASEARLRAAWKRATTVAGTEA